MWTIRNKDSVIQDFQQTDFVDLLRDQSNAEQYNFLIFWMTHMAVDIFPVLNCDIHNEVTGNCQNIGHGPGEGDEDEEDYIVTDDDEDEDVPQNPYILD